jgi:hypothetical protein
VEKNNSSYFCGVHDKCITKNIQLAPVVSTNKEEEEKHFGHDIILAVYLAGKHVYF